MFFRRLKNDLHLETHFQFFSTTSFNEFQCWNVAGVYIWLVQVKYKCLIDAEIFDLTDFWIFINFAVSYDITNV